MIKGRNFLRAMLVRNDGYTYFEVVEVGVLRRCSSRTRLYVLRRMINDPPKKE